jgi:ABC-type phosphate transport system auxiliary subunit
MVLFWRAAVKRMKKRPTDIVDKILAADVDALARAIREVQAKIQERKELARDQMRHLSSDLEDLAAQEERLSIWGPGYRPSIDRSRSDLKSRIHILKAEARDAELNFWRDTVSLEKELRILIAAYERAMRKRNLVGGDWQ